MLDRDQGREFKPLSIRVVTEGEIAVIGDGVTGFPADPFAGAELKELVAEPALQNENHAAAGMNGTHAPALRKARMPGAILRPERKISSSAR